MRIKDEILKNKNHFLLLCKNHNVKYLYAFGSAVSDKFDDKASDLDFVVEIESKDPIERGENLISLWDNFETFFNRRVDLLTDASIRNPFLRKNIDSSKILIYDGSRQKVLI
ncbi:MAG TPA: nucleotidyltransferase domain-containing protein [Bacteroidales bacterium]|jgi:predicted nucleotidyltransferase|nr:nucleotidyltransferase domain-containing protein [Bacteroidales bacterium]